MNLSYLLQCAMRELRRRRWRAGATALGYALAVAVLVVLATGLRFSRRAADAILSTTGTHFIAYVPAGAACEHCAPAGQDALEGFVAYGQATGLLPLSAIERAKELPGVLDASGYLWFRFRDAQGRALTVGGYDPANTAAVGTTCCAATDIISGRFLSPQDAGAVMLEEAYAALTGLKPGDSVTVAGLAMPIVGVVNPGIRPAKADVYMHFADAERLIDSRLGQGAIRNQANVMLVEVRSAPVQDQAIRNVKALLPGMVVSSYACYKPAAKVMGINAAGVWLLTAMAGLMAVALGLKSQLAAVIERRREVGILKAIGWTDGEVVTEVLAESVLQALVGGLAGCLAAGAVLLLAPIKAWSGIQTAAEVQLSPGVMLAGLLLALVGGLLAGAVPALLATRQSPADALRRI